MSELKCEVKTVMSVNYNDVNDIINKYYFNGVNSREGFHFCVSEECGNDSDHEFHVDGDLDEYDLEQIESRETTYMTGSYLNDLANKGIIDKGVYLVYVCW